jgi:hypothetical protein
MGHSLFTMLTGLEVYYHRAEEKYGEAAAREIWQLSQKTHVVDLLLNGTNPGVFDTNRLG